MSSLLIHKVKNLSLNAADNRVVTAAEQDGILLHLARDFVFERQKKEVSEPTIRPLPLARSPRFSPKFVPAGSFASPLTSSQLVAAPRRHLHGRQSRREQSPSPPPPLCRIAVESRPLLQRAPPLLPCCSPRLCYSMRCPSEVKRISRPPLLSVPTPVVSISPF
jgi:hypothetical protein